MWNLKRNHCLIPISGSTVEEDLILWEVGQKIEHRTRCLQREKTVNGLLKTGTKPATFAVRSLEISLGCKRSFIGGKSINRRPL